MRSVSRDVVDGVVRRLGSVGAVRVLGAMGVTHEHVAWARDPDETLDVVAEVWRIDCPWRRHRDRTPARVTDVWTSRASREIVITCERCERAGDVLDLVAAVEGLATFGAVLARARRLADRLAGGVRR